MRAYLVKSVTENLPTKIAALCLGVLIWAVVLGSRPVEVTKDVPLEYELGQGLTPASDLPTKVAFTLSGPKASLRAILDRREEPIVLKIDSAGDQVHTLKFDQIKIPFGLVKVVRIHPPQIHFKVEVLSSKILPVRVPLEGIPAEGYRVGKIEVLPNHVTAQAAESKVRALEEVVVSTVNVQGAHQTIEQEMALDASVPYLTTQPSSVRVKIEVLPEAANLKVRNVEIRAASPYKVELNPRKITLHIRASKANLTEPIDPKRITAVLDLRGKSKGEHWLVPKVTLPEGVQLVKQLPEKVWVKLY